MIDNIESISLTEDSVLDDVGDGAVGPAVALVNLNENFL